MFDETFTDFTINYDALNERNTLSSGDVVSGQVIFELSKEIKVNSITFALMGRANVAWSSGGGKNSRLYSASEYYFCIVDHIVEEHNNAVGAGETVLPKGRHVHPFRIQLPHGNFPSSFKGVNGRVLYSLAVEIRRPWHLAKEFQVDLNFVSHIDANQPQLLTPLAASKSKTLCCLCCTSEPISMSVRLEKKGYVPGEMIRITAEFENGSSRTLIPKAKLVQTQTVYTSSRASRKNVLKEQAKIQGRSVMPYSSGFWGEEMLQIPDHTPLTVSNCQILEVEYYLLVSLSIPNGVNLKHIFPLVLCSIPV